MKKSHNVGILLGKMLFSYLMEQKYSLKQVTSIIYTLEKNVFEAATFEGL